MQNQVISQIRLLSLLIYGIALFFGCAEKDVERHVFSLDDLPAPSKLIGAKHLYDEILNPNKIHFTGKYLIVGERKTIKNNKIHILDPRNRKYVSSKGIDGLGPGEITQVQQIEHISENEEFWTYDVEQLLFSKFEISDSSKLASEQVRTRESTVFITEATWASSNSVLGNMVDGWTKYIEISLSGDTLAFFGNWKDILIGRNLPNGHKVENLDANLVSNIHQGVLKGNLQKRMFVQAGSIVDYFEIIDLDKQTTRTFFGPIDQIPEFTIAYSMGYQMPDYNLNNLKNQYLDSYVGKNSFFLLYSNKNFRNLTDSSEPDRIFEFDFEGKPINHFILGNFKLSSFTVDEVSRKIYGISEDDNPNVVEFDY